MATAGTSTPSATFSSPGASGIQLQILTPFDPANPNCFVISGANDPVTMPQIQCQASVFGVAPDPTATTSFIWTVSLQHTASTCRHGQPQNNTSHPPISVTQTGGTFTVPFTAIRGGSLTITVATSGLAGGDFQVSSSGLSIIGQNPLKSVLSSAIDSTAPDPQTADALKRITGQESGLRQFVANADGGIGVCPLFSGDNLGGVGLFQITVPAPTADQIWSWRANLDAGVQILMGKRAIAAGYRQRVLQSSGYQQLVSTFNAANSSVTVTLATYTPQQLENDTIRGFNGYGGRDQFGLVLHEYRVPVDASGNLVVTLDAGGTSGTVNWEQVPATARPQQFGDPNYVNHVLTQSTF